MPITIPHNRLDLWYDSMQTFFKIIFLTINFGHFKLNFGHICPVQVNGENFQVQDYVFLTSEMKSALNFSLENMFCFKFWPFFISPPFWQSNMTRISNLVLCIFILASSPGVHTFFCLWRVNKKLPQGETSQNAFQRSRSINWRWKIYMLKWAYPPLIGDKVYTHLLYLDLRGDVLEHYMYFEYHRIIQSQYNRSISIFHFWYPF